MTSTSSSCSGVRRWPSRTSPSSSAACSTTSCPPGASATIVVATSGDTGSAAIEACVGRDTLDIVVLHPSGRVSDVQRRQMTTVRCTQRAQRRRRGHLRRLPGPGEGALRRHRVPTAVRLSAMNSINWARVMAQIVYYVTTVARLGRCSFVPTGNFGNIFSGWIAERMGLPIDQLVIGSNSNDILTRWATSTARSSPAPSYPPTACRWTSRSRRTTSGCSSSWRPRRRAHCRAARSLPGRRGGGGPARPPVPGRPHSTTPRPRGHPPGARGHRGARRSAHGSRHRRREFADR